ncbi:MAG: ABC transporter permease [Microthrixaceae bacterium]
MDHRQACPEVPGMFTLSLSAYTASGVVTLADYLFGFGVFELEARTLVTLSGMVVGNSLAATVLVGRRLIGSLQERRDEVEARLALLTAAGPRRRWCAVRFGPLDTPGGNDRAVGIVLLPGAMVGLLLAGSEEPAVKVQLAVMYLILGSVATTTAVVALGVRIARRSVQTTGWCSTHRVTTGGRDRSAAVTGDEIRGPFDDQVTCRSPGWPW